jgi:putative ABC transport system permease protein
MFVLSWWSRLRNHLRSNALSRDIDREIRFHLAERADDLVASGMRPGDARREARRRFGNLGLQAERTRERDIFAWLDVLIRDIRYSIRSLRNTPAFTLVAILSLGLGIGANTAIFSILDAVMLRALPVSHPEELVRIVRTERANASASDWSGIFTNPLWEQIRDRQDMFSGVFAYASASFDLANGGEARRIPASWISGDYFTTLGVRPELGRLIQRTDDFRGCPGTAVLSDGFWRREYGADPNVIGKTVSFDGHPFQIMGVADPGFLGMSVGEVPQAFVPLCAQTIVSGPGYLDRRSTWYLEIVGRPKADFDAKRIAARFSALAPAIGEATAPPNWSAKDIASYKSSRFSVEDASRGRSPIRTAYKKALYVLTVIVGLVLAVACANVANLLLARATARQREMAVRLALGASRIRLAQQLIVESLLLSFLGAALGSAFAFSGGRLLVGLMTLRGRAIVIDLRPDAKIFLFTTAIAVATGLLFGLVPAWRSGHVDPQAAIKSQGRGVAEGHSRFRIGKMLVAAQVALSLVLITGAGLLLGSWQKLATLDPGFRRDGVLIVEANIRKLDAPGDQRLPLYDRMLDRVRTVPGVRSAALAELTPVGSATWNDLLKVDGFTPTSQDDALSWINAVSDRFFTTMGVPLLSGRDFDARDVATAPKVAIVSEAMARKFFGTPAAVGRQFKVQQGDSWMGPVEVVGVVANTKYQSLRDSAQSIVFYPQAQQEADASSRRFVIWTAGPPLAVAPMVKAVVTEFNSRVTLEVSTMDRQLSDSMALSRAIALLSGFFGALALVLASVGLYGIMAYGVARRRNEIGVRIALGAEYARVVRMVLGEVGRIVTAGVVIGVAMSAGATRLVKSFLYGLTPTDPTTIAMAAGVLMVVGICAAAIPAWRAARLDPVAALRED